MSVRFTEAEDDLVAAAVPTFEGVGESLSGSVRRSTPVTVVDDDSKEYAARGRSRRDI